MDTKLDREKGRCVILALLPPTLIRIHCQNIEGLKRNVSTDLICQRAAERKCSHEASQNAKPGTIKCMQFTFSIDQPTLAGSANRTHPGNNNVNVTTTTTMHPALQHHHHDHCATGSTAISTAVTTLLGTQRRPQQQLQWLDDNADNKCGELHLSTTSLSCWPPQYACTHIDNHSDDMHIASISTSLDILCVYPMQWYINVHRYSRIGMYCNTLLMGIL